MEYHLLKGTLAIAFVITLLYPALSDDLSPTRLEPSGSLFKMVGERLNLVCSYVNAGIHNWSDSLHIQRCINRKCETLPSEIANRTSIRTSIESLDVEGRQTYTCSFKLQSNTTSLTYVWVGYRPSPPKDIYCFSKDHLEMNCTVTLADRDARSELGHNITIQFQSTRSTEWLECPNYSVKYNSCYWGAAEDLDYEFVIRRGYIIRAEVTNILGRNQSTLGISDTTSIVAISNLHQFKASNITSRTAVLTWVLPDRLLPVTFDIDFQINYTSRWDKYKQLHYTSKRKMKTVMDKLIPNTRYKVSIRGRGHLVTDERSWSPVKTVSFKTKIDAPSSAPRYTIGGYFLPGRGMNSTGDNCALQIYLKPIPRKRRNGDLSDMNYIVTFENKTKTKRIFDPITTLTLSHETCWNKGPYRMVVHACIKHRLCSIESSVINIPSVDADIPRAKEVIVEGSGNTTFRVSWSFEPAANESLVGDITIFWCRGKRDQHICKSKLSWQIIKKRLTDANITVKHSNYRDWIFAVSVATHDGQSSGMVFDDCQFIYDKTPSQEIAALASLKPTFNLLTRDGEENDMKSTDIISLSFRYCDVQFLHRKPELYEVFYKKSSGNRVEDCSKGAHSLNVTASLNLKEIVLPDLDPGTLYAVCMRIWTSVGASELSDVKWRKPIKYPDGVDVKLVVGLCILSLLVVLLTLALFIWCSRRKYEKLDVAIDIPTVESDRSSTIDEKWNSRKDSEQDSGFTSQDTSSNTSEERKRSMQYTTVSLQLPTEEKSADSDVVSDSQQNQSSDNKGRESETPKCLTQPQLSSTEKKNCNSNLVGQQQLGKTDKGTAPEIKNRQVLLDCCQTVNNDDETSISASDGMNTDEASDGDCYWIAGGPPDSGEMTKGVKNEPLMDSVDYNTAALKPPGASRSAKDANSRMVMVRLSDSYKQQLDTGMTLSQGDKEIETCNLIDHNHSSWDSDFPRDEDSTFNDLSRSTLKSDFSENEACIWNEQNRSTRGSDFSEYDFEQIASFDDLNISMSAKLHEENCHARVKPKHADQIYQVDVEPSRIPSNREHSPLKSRKTYFVSLETSCKVKPKYQSNTYQCKLNDTTCREESRYASNKQLFNLEEESLIGHLNYDDQIEMTNSEPNTDASVSKCEPSPVQQIMEDSNKYHSMTLYASKQKQLNIYCEPHENYSGSGCEPAKDNYGANCESQSDQTSLCHGNNREQCNTGIVSRLERCKAVLDEEQPSMCRDQTGVHMNNSPSSYGRHRSYKTLDDNKDTSIKNKRYVAKLC